MSRKTVIFVARICILAFVVGLLWYAWDKYAALQWRTEHIESLTLSIQQPPELVSQAVNSDDQAAKIAYRATTETDAKKPYLVTIRSEDGLRRTTSLTRQEMIPLVLTNSEKSLPGRFPEFAKKSTQQYEVDGHKAGEIMFTYKNPAGSITEQRFVVIDKDGNTAIYASFQAKESDFDQLNQQIFQKMIDSVQLR